MHKVAQAAIAPPTNQAYCCHLVTETSLNDLLLKHNDSGQNQHSGNRVKVSTTNCNAKH